MRLPAEMVRSGVVEQISKPHAAWASRGYICIDDLNRFRSQYVRSLFEIRKGKMPLPKQGVLESFEEHDVLARDVSDESKPTQREGSSLESMTMK